MTNSRAIAVIDGEVEEERELSVSPLEAQTRGEIDIQIVTAKRFPRSLATFKKTALEMATLDEETAESCLYALPRGGKTIDGPSARLAEIIASAYGHMRIEGRVVSIDDKFVTARGTSWDLQNNVAKALEVKRRITGKDGNRYNDDMIMVASNAAVSIASRNSTLATIPKAHWQPIYNACRQIVAGDSKTLASRRFAMLEHFLKLGVLNDRVFQSLGVKGLEDITLDHLVTLKGVAAAIKNGEVTVEGAFDSIESGTPVEAADAFLSGLAPEEQAEMAKLFVDAKVNVAQRTVLLRKHKGNPKALATELRAMAAPKPTEDTVKPPVEDVKLPTPSQESFVTGGKAKPEVVPASADIAPDANAIGF